MENPSSSLPASRPTVSEKQHQGKAATAAYHTALRSVRKPTPAKPGKKPDQPPRPHVYRVHPRGFRELVQRLTGAAPLPAARPLRETAPPPPPLDLARPPRAPTPPAFDNGSSFTTEAARPMDPPETASGQVSPTAFGGLFSPGMLSPSFYSSWCSFPLLSPASMATLEHSVETVL